MTHTFLSTEYYFPHPKPPHYMTQTFQSIELNQIFSLAQPESPLLSLFIDVTTFWALTLLGPSLIIAFSSSSCISLTLARSRLRLALSYQSIYLLTNSLSPSLFTDTSWSAQQLVQINVKPVWPPMKKRISTLAPLYLNGTCSDYGLNLSNISHI